MAECHHNFKKDADGEVLCVLCGDKDDEMIARELVQNNEKPDFWATQTNFE